MLKQICNSLLHPSGHTFHSLLLFSLIFASSHCRVSRVVNLSIAETEAFLDIPIREPSRALISMLNCNTYSTNAPIICNAVAEAESFASLMGKPLEHVDPILLITSLRDASQKGGWCLVDCSAVETDALREAVAVIWLQGNWDHHPDFRSWFVHSSFMTPLTSQFTLENTSNGFSLSPARGSTVAARLRIEAANSHLPLSLVAGAVYLKYTDNFEDEFNIRSLVNAVGNSQLFYTREYRRFIVKLQERHVLGLFRLAVKEDVFLALAGCGEECDIARRLLISARGDAHESVIDIALKNEFVEAASLLRDFGCVSDSFDFNDLLKPSFAVALRVLLQPGKPFPFDPVATVSHVAREGHAEILRRLFQCRVDSDFSYLDYPLAGACCSGSEDVIWIVLDRMGSTGVSPLTDARWAYDHLLLVLLNSTGDVSCGFSMNVPTAHLVERFLTILEGEGVAYHFPVDVLVRAKGQPKIIQRLMAILDPHAEPNAPALLGFFADFDPASPHVEAMVRRAFREMHTRRGSRPVEVEVYHLLWQLIRKGRVAGAMYRVAVDCSVHFGHLDFTFRGDAGDTLLHKAVSEKLLDVSAVGYTLYRMRERDRLNFIHAEDSNGRSAIEALLSNALSVPLSTEEEHSLADCLRLMLFAGGQLRDDVAAGFYARCVRAGLSSLAYELLHASKRFFDFTVLPSDIAIGMALRSREAEDFGEDRYAEDLERASDSLTLEEMQRIKREEGRGLQTQLLVTVCADVRLEQNALPFRGTAGDQQKVLASILDFSDRRAFNAFRGLCFATRFSTLGRPIPPKMDMADCFPQSHAASHALADRNAAEDHAL